MKNHKPGRLKLLLSLFLSLGAVFVASIASFAWFQATYIANTISDKTTTGATSNTGDLNIQSVKGYKYTYDDYGDGTGASGSVTGESAHGNIDNDSTEILDVPTEGVGFYILGDATWAALQGKESTTAFKFSSAVKMTDKYADNFAKTTAPVTLSVNEEIRFVQHTYGKEGEGVAETRNNIYNTVNSASTSIATCNGNNIRIDVSGTYDIYINWNKEICFNAVSGGGGSSNSKPGLDLTRKNAQPVSRDFVTLYPGDINWFKDNVWVAAYFFNDTTSNCWSPAQKDSGASYMTFEVPGDYNNLIFARFSPDKKDFTDKKPNSWNDVYNQTGDINGFSRGGAYTITGWKNGTGGKSGHSSVSAVAGYYLVGRDTDAGADFFGTTSGWNYEYAIRIDGRDDNDRPYIPSITIPANVEFKIFQFSSDGTAANDKKWGFGSINDATAVASTSDNQNVNITREIKCSITLKDSRIHIVIEQVTISYSYEILSPSGSSISTGNAYPTSTTVYYGATVAKASLVTPSIDGYGTWNYWYTDPSLSIETKFESMQVKSDLSLYASCREEEFTLTIYIAHTLPNSYERDTDVALVTKTIEHLTLSSAITLADLNTACDSPESTTTYNWLGYYTSYASNASLSSFPLTAANCDAVFSFAGSHVIYGLYQPMGVTVTYEYQLWLKNAHTGEMSLYNESPTIENDTFTGYKTTSFILNDHQPGTQTYVVAESDYDVAGIDNDYPAYFSFNWGEELIYYRDTTKVNNIGAAYTNTILSTDTTLIVKLVATYEQMHVVVRCLDSDWIYDSSRAFAETNHILTHLDTSPNEVVDHRTTEEKNLLISKWNDPNVTGDFYLKKDGVDESYSFYVSTSGIAFQIRSSSATGGNGQDPKWTTNISSLSGIDSFYGERGEFADAIEVTNDLEYGNHGHRKWAWSVYYGNENTATLMFADGSSASLVKGDGVFNMFVLDAGLTKSSGSSFTLKLVYEGITSWYGYDELSSLSQPFVTEGDETPVWGNKKAIILNSDGDYTFYFTAGKELSIASVPKEKGEGYYIMQYDSTGVKGNKNTVSYHNGVKMRKTANPASGQNVATYMYFQAVENEAYYFKSYLNGVDRSYATLGDTYAYAHVDNGTVVFDTSGNYNIFLKWESDGTYKIYIVESEDDFYALNQIPTAAISANDVKSGNTSLILEIGFTYTGAEAEIGITINRKANSIGLSNYIKFSVYCYDPGEGDAMGRDSYSYMRSNCYSNLVGFSSGSQTKLGVFDTTNKVSTATTHYLYLMIDYASVGAASNSPYLFNDFTMQLTARS